VSPAVDDSRHPSSEEIDRYAARSCVAAEAAAIRRHMLGCPGCRERLRASPFYPEQGRRETDLIAGLEPRPGCPSPAARVAFVVDALPAERRAEVAEHRRGCAACAGDLRALQALRERAGTQARVATERPGCLLSIRRRGMPRVRGAERPRASEEELD
jgi:hypothetical protein